VKSIHSLSRNPVVSLVPEPDIRPFPERRAQTLALELSSFSFAVIFRPLLEKYFPAAKKNLRLLAPKDVYRR
jgi:hypothetical protein